MRPPYALLLGLACLLPLSVAAQWQWIDKDGRRVFSDTAPPPGTPPQNILRQPGVRPSAAGASAAAASAPAAGAAAPAVAARTAASAPRAPSRDPALEEKLKQAEAAKAQQAKAEAERVAKARAENCSRAKEAKATYDSGIRIARTNAKGEREILDDKQRAEEVKRLQALIASECGATPAP